jgi:catechol 2,3-dioxygenase-like lactoylglutathione lyase family enzyme
METNMIQSYQVVAFVATRDGRRAREFYEGILGLPVVSDDPYALALDAHGTKIRIQKVESFTPHPFTALGWEVSSIDDTVEALRARGVSFEMFSGMGQDTKGIWQAPSGARVAWFKDPDGNTLSLTQL